MNEPFDAEIEVVAEVELPSGADALQLEQLVRSVLIDEGARGDWTVTVALVGDDALRDLHRRFMDDDSVTDVMTFPVGASAPDGGGGDIIVSVERAAAQAGEWKSSVWDEVRFLAVHGTLHMLGWRDDTAQARAGMLARQSALIERFDAGAR